jgi:hypothetical protein
MTVQQLLAVMLSQQWVDILTDQQREAFEGMRGRTQLSPRQEKWVRGVADRLGIEVAPSENVFSEMAPEQQREHKRRAEKIVFPWQEEGYVKPLKPPGKR